MPHKVNEVELAVTFPNGGRIQLLGVENQEALRGISNWGGVGCDEYDDWEEDIWPTIIRPNLVVHKAPAIISGTPKGFRNMHRLELNPDFKAFHFTTYDNPDLDPEELKNLEREYRSMGEDYYMQEIMAEYVKPVGTVYKEWDHLSHFKPIQYDPNLPLHISLDFGVNDPTAIIWLQPNGGEVAVIDYEEITDVGIEHIIQIINSKSYKVPELITGDPAGMARSQTTGTSPIEEMANKGMHVRHKFGVKIPDQIRIAHTYMPRLFVNSDRCERFRDCILNYRYPEKKESMFNQENEIPIHDQFSHAMRAFEYWAVNYGDISLNPQEPLLFKAGGDPVTGYGKRIEYARRRR